MVVRSIFTDDKGVAMRKSSKEAKRTWLAQAIAQQLDKKEQATLRGGEIISA